MEFVGSGMVRVDATVLNLIPKNLFTFVEDLNERTMVNGSEKCVRSSFKLFPFLLFLHLLNDVRWP